MSGNQHENYRTVDNRWIGRVPHHWSISPLKRVAKIGATKRLVSPSDRYVGLENVSSWTGRILTSDTEATADGVGVEFHAGDVLFGKLRPYLAKVALVDFDGIASTELLVLRGEHLEPRFLQYSLVSRPFIDAVNAATYGVKMPRANWEDVGSLPQPLPPLPEQRAIADFLDCETAKIDALIVKQEELIERIEEKKKAFIVHSVMGRVNKSMVLVPTGNPWIGSIPNHWCLSKLGYRFEVQLGKMLDARQITGKHLKPYLRNIDVQWGRVNVLDLPEMDFDDDDRKRFSLKSGDILVCEGGEIGRSAIWAGELQDCYYQKALHRLRPIRNDDSHYAFWLMNAAANSGVFSEGANKTTIEHLPAEKLRAHVFPFPPISEQRAIADSLDHELAKINALISKQSEIKGILLERRSALITAAVTGQIEIPTNITNEAAA